MQPGGTPAEPPRNPTEPPRNPPEPPRNPPQNDAEPPAEPPGTPAEPPVHCIRFSSPSPPPSPPLHPPTASMRALHATHAIHAGQLKYPAVCFDCCFLRPHTHTRLSGTLLVAQPQHLPCHEDGGAKVACKLSCCLERQQVGTIEALCRQHGCRSGHVQALQPACNCTDSASLV